MANFKAVVVEKGEAGPGAPVIRDFADADLMDGDVTSASRTPR
jgi:hypothetical protein